MRWLIVLLMVFSFASEGRADVLPPPECPHALPAEGSSCRSGGPAACTYTAHGVARICTCRTGHWACEVLPAAPHS